MVSGLDGAPQGPKRWEKPIFNTKSNLCIKVFTMISS